MSKTILLAFTILGLAFLASASEHCKDSTLYCQNKYCCKTLSRAYEHCCTTCSSSVHYFDHLCLKQYDWWSVNGWWVNLLRYGIPAAVFLIGLIVFLILVCTGKVKVGRWFGRNPNLQRGPPVQMGQQTVTVYPGTAPQMPQPPPYGAPPGGSYPVQQNAPYPTQSYPEQNPPPQGFAPPAYSTAQDYGVPPTAMTKN